MSKSKQILGLSDGKFPIITMLLLYGAIMLLTALLISVFYESAGFFFGLAAGIILGWVVVVLIYYLWAIHFYNVNMGWTQEDWDKLDDKKSKQNLSGIVDDEPVKNPHAEETLGLPPGTVRGTLAVSLLVAALAMMVASLDMEASFDPNRIYVDNFEFIKTAFLMMVAFYFGNKSIKALGSRNQGVYIPTDKEVQGASSNAPASTSIPRSTSSQMGAAKQALQSGKVEEEPSLDEELKDSEAKS